MGCHNTIILTESTSLHNTHNTSSHILKPSKKSRNTHTKGLMYFSRAIKYSDANGFTDKSIIYLKRATMCYHTGAFYGLIELYRDNDMMRKYAIYLSMSRLLS